MDLSHTHSCPIHLLSYAEHGWFHWSMASFQVPSRLIEALGILPGLDVEAPRRIPPPHVEPCIFKPSFRLDNALVFFQRICSRGTSHKEARMSVPAGL